MDLRIEDGGVSLGGREVLHDVSLRLAPGRLTAILGPNGAGKSTLIRALAGVLPLDRGSVWVGDQHACSFSRRENARWVGYLPQQAEVPFPFPVEEVVLMGRYPYLERFRPEGLEDRAAVARALRIADADSLRGRPVTELSGGERQRVLLARTLAAETPCLLLDEPVASLDIGHSLDLLEILRRLADEGRTIALALHDLNLAYQHCSHFVLLSEGRLVAEGPAESVFRPELLRETFAVEPRFVVENGTRLVAFRRREP